MKEILNEHRLTLLAIFGGALVIVTTLTAWAQTAPVLTMAKTGTNTFSISITNGVPTNVYNLYRTPVLDNLTAYPWKFVTNGTAGQTNFTVTSGAVATEFYQVMVATNNTIGSFGMFIDSPVNGANLTQ
jgi:hypothetical protein